MRNHREYPVSRAEVQNTVHRAAYRMTHTPTGELIIGGDDDGMILKAIYDYVAGMTNEEFAAHPINKALQIT